MQNLRLVFINFHPGGEQAPIPFAPGKLREQHIGCAGEQELDAAAAANHAQQVAPEFAGGQKISGYDTHVARGGEVVVQGFVQRTGGRAGAVPERNRGGQNAGFAPAFEGAQAEQGTAAEIGERKQFVEGRGQFGDQFGSQQPHAEVAPAVSHAVAVIFIREIKPAGEGGVVIADQQFTMVAHAEPPEPQRIEAADFSAGRDERCKKIAGQQPGAERIHQHEDAHAALGGRGEGGAKLPAKAVVGIDVSFEPDGVARGGNGGEHGRKNFPAGAEPLRGGGGGHRVFDGGGAGK